MTHLTNRIEQVLESFSIETRKEVSGGIEWRLDPEWKYEATTRLLELFEEMASEVIGNDTATVHAGLVGETHKDTNQNELRAEQRQALKEMLGEEK